MATRYRARSYTTPSGGRRAARRLQEHRINRWVIALFVGVLALVIAIPAVGYFFTFVLPPRETIVNVNGSKHSLGQVFKRTQANINLELQLGSEPEIGTLPFTVVNDLITDELLRQNASKVNVFVTQDDITAEIRRLLYPAPPTGQQVDDAALEKEFQERLRQHLNLTRFTEGEYREVVRASLLRNRIRETLSDRVPTVAEQVYVHWIKVLEDDSVTQVQQRLAAGDSFESLARIYSRVDIAADDNGEVGWIPKGAYPTLDTFLFPSSGELEYSKVSDPIPAEDGSFYFLKVTDGPQTLEINETMRNRLQNRALQQWLEEQRAANFVDVNFTSAHYSWVISKIREMVPPSALAPSGS
ncbi:MAG: SurA N-terminal domain-containing protein [Chloroflexi bacterium]|nr:SurA N-terminal domain-containing protein [Chloroflexota bacterium]